MTNQSQSPKGQLLNSTKTAWLGANWDYWFDRETWSSYMAFLLIMAGILLVALPSTLAIRNLTPNPFEFTDLFVGLYAVLFGILAITLGQSELSWQYKLRPTEQLIHLFSRQLLGILLTVPYWVIYVFSNLFNPLVVVGAIFHFALFGSVLGLFGWRLSLTHRPEIFQFNIKYMTLIGLLVVSFFVQPLQFLNPILPIITMIGETGTLSSLSLIGFYLVWSMIGIMLAISSLKRVQAERKEQEAYEVQLSRH